MNSKERKLVETVENLGDDIIDFTLRLVSEPSTLGNEEGAVHLMEMEMIKLGLTTVSIPLADDRVKKHPGYAPTPWEDGERRSVVGTLAAGSSGGKSALFNGHLDVVSTGNPTFWTRDPFTPEIVDGWIYGRGAGDMKSGVAAMTYAVHALEKAGFRLCGDVHVEAVIEEECSGNGAIACRAAGYDGDAVLIPEPFGPTILTDQVGVMWFKVSICGRPTHVLEAPSGVNAIEKCYPLIDGLRRLETQLNEIAVPESYRDKVHPLNLNIGIIEGGDWPSTVAAEASFHARLSFFPGTEYLDICALVEEAIAKVAREDSWLNVNTPKVEYYGFRSPGHSLPRDLPAFSLLDRCHSDLTGNSAATYISTCTTDLRAFHFYGSGQPTCYGPVSESIHGIDERVDIDSIIQVARTYALFLARWCTIVE